MQASRRAQGRRLSGNNPGEGPDFVDLADRMLKAERQMAFVLPVTAITGSSWQNVRKLWAEEYHDVLVITIAMKLLENVLFSRYQYGRMLRHCNERVNQRTLDVRRLYASNGVPMVN